jgi:hypothetical protein
MSSGRVSGLRAVFEADRGRQDGTDAPARRAPAAPKLLRAAMAGRDEPPATPARCAEGRIVSNAEGSVVALGKHPAYSHLYYCGQKRDIPGSDGVCGTSLRPQHLLLPCPCSCASRGSRHFPLIAACRAPPFCCRP